MAFAGPLSFLTSKHRPSGRFAWTVNVNRYGDYTGVFDVTSNGVTEVGTVSGTVGPAQGSNCTLPAGG